MNAAQDSVLSVLNDIIRADAAAAARVSETLRGVVQRLNASIRQMEWETVPLTTFAGRLPESIRSCWIFVIRPNSATGAERHSPSHPRAAARHVYSARPSATCRAARLLRHRRGCEVVLLPGGRPEPIG